MAAVCVTRTADGFTVTRTFRSMAAAQRGLDALLAVNEAAFVPVPPQVELDPATSAGPPVIPHTLRDAILRDAPDGPIGYPVTVDEE
jgi:hypothetical protein